MPSASNPLSSPTANPSSSRVSKHRSITDIIADLRSSFRDGEYDDAQTELLAREENLRRETEEMGLNWRILEGRYKDLYLKFSDLERERDRLLREARINDDKLADFAIDLKVAKEAEKRANGRYGAVLHELEAMEKKNSETLGYLRSEMEGLKRKMREKNEKIDGLVRKSGEVLEDDSRGVEPMVLVEDLRKENKLLQRVKEESDADMCRLLKILEERQGIIDQLKMKIDADMEQVRRIGREKDDRIDELLKINEGLEIEKFDYLREIEVLNAEKRQLEMIVDRTEMIVSELESSVATWMMSNVAKDKKLGNAEAEKVLSGFIEFLDSKETEITRASQVEKDGEHGVSGDSRPEKGVSPMSHIIDLGGGRAEKDNKVGNVQSGFIDSEDTGVIPDEHLVDGHVRVVETGVQKGASPVIEIESGSDEGTCRPRQTKRKLRKRAGEGTSSDDTLNRCRKLKRLNDLPHESVKRELCTPKSHGVSTVRKCNDKIREEGNFQGYGRSAKVDQNYSLRPKLLELLEKCQRSKGNKCQ